MGWTAFIAVLDTLKAIRTQAKSDMMRAIALALFGKPEDREAFLNE